MKRVCLTAIFCVCVCGVGFSSTPPFTCVEVISQEVFIDEDTTFNCRLHFIGDGALFIVSGVAVQISIPITAERKEIFRGPGAVQLTRTSRSAVGHIAFPEWFGADPSGETDSSLPFQKAVDALVHGGTLLGEPTATYRLEDDVVIRHSYTTFDMSHALIKGRTLSRKIRCNGDFEGHEPGDWSVALRECIVRNIRIGDANDSRNRFGGVVLRWCIGCGAENIVKKGETGTGFTMSVCRNCFFRNITNLGSFPRSGRFGFLLHMTWDAIVENCHVKDGPFFLGFQVKGGRRATIINSSISNVFKTDDVTPQYGFFDRGDAPWKPSATAQTDITYPFRTGSWDEPDIRRASHNTRGFGLSVVDAPTVLAYRFQESIGAFFHDVRAENVRAGLGIGRQVDGQESRFRFENFFFKETLARPMTLQSTDIEPLETVRVGFGEIVSENAVIVLRNTRNVSFECIVKNGHELQRSDLTEINTTRTVVRGCRSGPMSANDRRN